MGNHKPLHHNSDKPPLNGYHDFYDSDDYRNYLANKRYSRSMAQRIGFLSIDIFLFLILLNWLGHLSDLKEIIFCVAGIVYFVTRAAIKVYKFVVNVGKTSDDFKKGMKAILNLFDGE